MMEGPWCRFRREKHEPASDIDTALMDSLEVLDPERPSREADIVRPPRQVRLVPFQDSCIAAIASYSMTSSARASSAGGIARPSAFAVLRLMTISYFVGACTGSSA